MGFFITTSLFPFVVLTFFGVPMSKESSDASLSERERGDGRFLELVDSASEADFELYEEVEFLLDLSRSIKSFPKSSSESQD